MEAMGPDSVSWFLRGRGHQRLEQQEEAIRCFEQGIAANPEDSLNRAALAAERAEGQPGEALQLVQKGREFCEDPEEYYTELVGEVMAVHSPQLLTQLGDQVLKEFPLHGIGTLARAIGLRQAGQFSTALQELRAALSRQPAQVMSHLLRLELCRGQLGDGQVKEAELTARGLVDEGSG